MTPKKFLYLKLALDRQVHDSIRIEELAEKEEECSNLRREWRGHKLPGITNRSIVCSGIIILSYLKIT